ncbi:PhzF family phenazine biosynthesis protein [Chitiniphilus shinanonensis]|uniref:PhzF family phenazine biosynthesis protein n=1 Tax=Chitiniphilus shinanonensis TaxID=553088 RepID=UPI003036B577
MALLLRFHHLNVFGERRTGGGGVVVCETPEFPDARTMQALAYQLQAPETVFLDVAHRRLRVYTPQYEQPFSGQALLAAAASYAQLTGERGPQLFYGTHGDTRVWPHDDLWWFHSRPAAARPSGVDVATLAAGLGLQAQDVAGVPRFINAGMDILLVETRSRQSVLQATPDPALLAQYAQAPGQVSAAAVWCRDGDLATLRVFNSDQFNLYEEFGSGTAAAAIGGWMLNQGGKPPLSLKLEQGHTIHRLVTRLSVLHLHVDDARHVRVGGKVWRVGGGEIEW